MKLNSMDVLKEVPELTVVPCVIHAMHKKFQHYQDKILNISTVDHSRCIANSSLEQDSLENYKLEENSKFNVNECEVLLESYENFCEQLSNNVTFENIACSSATEEIPFNLHIMGKGVSQPNDFSFSEALPESSEDFNMNCDVIKNENQDVEIKEKTEECLLTLENIASHQDVWYDVCRVTKRMCVADGEIHLSDTSATDSVNRSDYESDTLKESKCIKSYKPVKNAEDSLSCLYRNINFGSNEHYNGCREHLCHFLSPDSIDRDVVDAGCQEIKNKVTRSIEQPLFQYAIKSQNFNASVYNQQNIDGQMCSIPGLLMSNSTDKCNSKLNRSFVELNDDYNMVKHTHEIWYSGNSLDQQHNEYIYNTNVCNYYTGNNTQLCGIPISGISNKPYDEFESRSIKILKSDFEQVCVTGECEQSATVKVTCPCQSLSCSTCIITDKKCIEVQSYATSPVISVNRSLDTESYCNDIGSHNNKVGTTKRIERPCISTVTSDRIYSYNISSNNVNDYNHICNNEQSNERINLVSLPPLKIKTHTKKCSQNSKLHSQSAVSINCNFELNKDRPKQSSLPPLKLKKLCNSNTHSKTTYRAHSETYLRSTAITYSAENCVKEEVNYNYESSDYIIEDKSSNNSSLNTIEFGPSSGKNMKYCKESSEHSGDESLNYWNMNGLNRKAFVFPYLDKKLNPSGVDTKECGKHKTSSKKPFKLPPVLSKTSVCGTEFTMIDSDRIKTTNATFCGEHCVLSESCIEHITTFDAKSSIDSIQTETENHRKASRIPVPTFSSISKALQYSFKGKNKLMRRNVVGQPFVTSRLPVSVKNTNARRCGKEKDAYNPFTSAERQMMELLGQDDKTKSTSSPVSSSSPNSNKNPVVPLSAPVAEKITSPVLVTSPKSAFIKFSPIEVDKSTQNTIERLSPEHSVDTGSESKTAEEASNASTPLPDNSEQGSDKNKNPISLSSLSLCSSISIESIDSNKNFLRKGISHSAKNEEKRNEVTPLKRSSSVSQSPRSGREFLRTKLKMEDLLYGPNMPVNKNDFFFGSPIDSNNQFQEGISNESSSDSSLHKSLSDAETLNAEQEFLKSMTELLYISSSPPPRSQSPSIKFTPSLISSLQPSEPNSESLKQSKDEVEPSLYDQSPTIKFCPDSAYNSLNRKSPPDDMSVNTEKDSNSSGSEHSFPLVQPPNSARFCHECGAKYPVAAAKFCCQCGVRRLTI